jgi:DnaJ family protein A protein 2
VKEKNRHEIIIERGMADRQRIVLAGAGDQEVHGPYSSFSTWLTLVQPGVPVGDVIFVLKASPHESFERSGNDLLTNVSITLSEALLGFSRILITHLDGRGIKVTSPPGKIISAGESIVLRGEGMPVHKSPDQKGNLYVVLHIDMPDENWLKSINRKVRRCLFVLRRTDNILNPRDLVTGVDVATKENGDIATTSSGR